VSASPFRSFDLGEGLLVLDRARHELAVLNATAAVAWRLFDEGMDLDDVIEAFVARLAVDTATVRADLLPLWQRRGADVPAPPPPPPAPGPVSPRHRVVVAMDGGDVVVESDDPTLIDGVAGRLFHRRVAGGEAAHVVVVAQQEDGYVCAGADRVQHAGDREAALGTVFEMVIALGQPQAPPLVLVHGAAVSDGRRSLLLPGLSGSGKSTLAAMLAAAGLIYLGDDLVGLGRNGAVSALPSAVAVKPGRMEAFCSAVGCLPPPAARCHEHARGTFVDPAWLGPSAAVGPPVGLVVFPRFRAGSDLTVESLDPPEALALAMAGAGLAVLPAVASDGAAVLATLFGTAPCRSVTYGADAPVAALLRRWCDALP